MPVRRSVTPVPRKAALEWLSVLPDHVFAIAERRFADTPSPAAPASAQKAPSKVLSPPTPSRKKRLGYRENPRRNWKLPIERQKFHRRQPFFRLDLPPNRPSITTLSTNATACRPNPIACRSDAVAATGTPPFNPRHRHPKSAARRRKSPASRPASAARRAKSVARNASCAVDCTLTSE